MCPPLVAQHLAWLARATLLLRGSTSSVDLACLQLARAPACGDRDTRSEAKAGGLIELGAAGHRARRRRFLERTLAALPDGGADGAVDLIDGAAMLVTLRLLRPGATACYSGSLSNRWTIPDLAPIA